MGFKVASRVRGLSDEAFREAFGTEEQCRTALVRLRWPDGFVCPCCGHREHCVLAGRGLYQCNRCKKQTSPTAGTIFHADLAACPWIDFDRPRPAGVLPATPDADRPGLDSVLERLFRDTGRRVATIFRAGAAGLFPMAQGPWLAWLPLDFLDRMNGLRLKPLPVSIGRYSYRNGAVEPARPQPGDDLRNVSDGALG